jgi:hypothetical protein
VSWDDLCRTGIGCTTEQQKEILVAHEERNQPEDPAQDVKKQGSNADQQQSPAYQAPDANNQQEVTLTNVTYNETGSLSGNAKAKPGAPGSDEQLHTARVEVAEVAERVLESEHPGRVQASDTLSSRTLSDLSGGNKKVIAALNDSLSAARSALGGSNLSNGAMHYRTSSHILKSLYGKPAVHFGPFRDALGGKTYIMVAP